MRVVCRSSVDSGEPTVGMLGTIAVVDEYQVIVGREDGGRSLYPRPTVDAGALHKAWVPVYTVTVGDDCGTSTHGERHACAEEEGQDDGHRMGVDDGGGDGGGVPAPSRGDAGAAQDAGGPQRAEDGGASSADPEMQAEAAAPGSVPGPTDGLSHFRSDVDALGHQLVQCPCVIPDAVLLEQCQVQLKAAERRRDEMAETLTRAQERCTGLLDRARGAERERDEARGQLKSATAERGGDDA